MATSTTTPTPGVYINPKTGKKTFIPLENNPAIFTDLIHRLGVSPNLVFHDIYSLSDPDLLSLIPRPVHAIIFIAPADVYHRVRASDPGNPARENLTYDRSGDQEPVIWFRQTIGHSCGLMALIHSLANGSAREFVLPGSLLDSLLEKAIPLKPAERAKVLYDSLELEQAHMACAVKGDTVPPSSEEPNGYHFISFVRGKDGHLWELEGGWDGPIDRGDVLGNDGEGLLGRKALKAGVGRFVEEAKGNLEFSMVALATRGKD